MAANRSFWKSRWLWSVCAVTLAIPLFITFLWYRQQTELAAKLAALKAEGLPTTAAEVNDFYNVPAGVADSTQAWIKAINAATATPLGHMVPLGYVGTGNGLLPGEKWPDIRFARALLQAFSREMKLIETAAEVGGQARFPADFSGGSGATLSNSQEIRGVAKLLRFDAEIAARDGDADRALRDIRSLIAARESLRGEPTFTTQL